MSLVISTDQNGLTEVWDSETGDFPTTVSYEFMSDTGFMELVRAKTHALSVCVREEILAMYCRDRKVRIFSIKSGKLLKTIDETLAQYSVAEKGSIMYLEKFDLERRMAVEREIERQWDTPDAILPSIGFDESGTYLYYGSPVGIKVVSVRTG